jgi:protease I
MGSKKILQLVGDFAEDYEVMVPFQALTMVGHSVHVVCPNKKSGECIATSIHESEGEQTYSEKRGHNFILNGTFSEVKSKKYDALLISGGRAPEYLRLDEHVIALVREFFEENKPVAAVCHGSQILTAADVVRGRSLTAYPAVKPEIISAGGKWVDVGPYKCHTDGVLVTAEGWSAHPAWLAAFLKVLGTKIDL